MNKQERFNKICRDIKSLKIQGASTLAKKAFYAYKLIPTEESKKKLLLLRPTEPMLKNILKKYNNLSYQQLNKKLETNQESINKGVYHLIKNNFVVFTHCHATSVTNALIYSKKKGKKFEVYNTETRPLFQGRKTSIELKKFGIPVTTFVDSAALIAMTKEQKTKKTDLIVLGADAVTKKGVVNKVGSAMFAEIARNHKIPFYIVTDSLKFSREKIKLEERNFSEVWKIRKIKVLNPAFEFIPKRLITGIVSEIGLLTFKEFVKKASRN